MNFCIITPIAGLERYATLSRTHLLLSHLKQEEYWRFYKQRREAGDFIILDNGAYEGQMDANRLLDRIRYIKPNAVALPDHLCQSWHKTWHDSQAFLDSYFYEVEGVEWMYIPQAEPGDIIGFVEGLMRALDDERIKWIGLPRALAYAITQDPFMRVKMAEQIHKRNSHVKIHAFGMVKGDVEELKLLRSIRCVTSIDSNAPVWRGWCGYSLRNGRWDEHPVEYDAEPALTIDTHEFVNDELILDNLEACGVNTNVRSRT